MRGRNLGVLWDCFDGRYLTSKGEVREVLGVGDRMVTKLLENAETLTVGKGIYYRTLDVIDIIENNFNRKGT